MPPALSQKQAGLPDPWNKLADKIIKEQRLITKDSEKTIESLSYILGSVLKYRRRLLGRDGVINGECVGRILDIYEIPTKYRPEVASLITMELTDNHNIG